MVPQLIARVDGLPVSLLDREHGRSELEQHVRVGDRDQQRRRPPDGVVAAHHSSPARSSSERISNRSDLAACSAISACAHAGKRHSCTHAV